MRSYLAISPGPRLRAPCHGLREADPPPSAGRCFLPFQGPGAGQPLAPLPSGPSSGGDGLAGWPWLSRRDRRRGGGRRCGIPAPADAGARAAVVYEPITVSAPRRAQEGSGCRGGRPLPGQTREQPLRDLTAPGPGPGGLCPRSRSPSRPSPLVPHSRLTVRREASGSRLRAVPSRNRPTAPPSLCSPRGTGESCAHALARVAPGLEGEGQDPTREARSTTGIVVGCGGLSCTHQG
nr:translation initiation factor IF-2-like [Equus asinus]